MATNHYKGSANRIDEDELPDDVQDELSATFSPDIIHALLRDAYYRGPIGVGSGGERRVYGGGSPGTGLRRPDGPLYDYPESWRSSVLRKATETDLIQNVHSDEVNGGGYVVTDRGLDLLLETDRCEECGRVNRPTLKDANSKRRLTKVRTACVVHGNGGGYERDEDELEKAEAMVGDTEGVHYYANDDSELSARDPDGLTDELHYGDLVEDENGREGVVVEPAETSPNKMGDANNFTASESEVVALSVQRDEDGEISGFGRGKVYDRTELRFQEEGVVQEVPVWTEGANVRVRPDGLTKTVVRREGDYYVLEHSSSNPYSEGEPSTTYAHALELSATTRRLGLPDPEFSEGDEVRYLHPRDRDKDYRLGQKLRVGFVQTEDYDEEKGYYYSLVHPETGDYVKGGYAYALLPEAEASERDPDGPTFEEGDLVTVEDEEGVWKVYDEGTPNVSEGHYSYRLVPKRRPSKSERNSRSGVIRKDLYARNTRISETDRCEECGAVGNEDTDPDVKTVPTAPVGADYPGYKTLCSECR